MNGRQALLNWGDLLPLLLLLCLLVTAGHVLARNGPLPLDTLGLLWFRAADNPAQLAGPAGMAAVWKGLTWTGDTLPRIVAGLLVMALLWWGCRRRAAAVFLAAVLLSGTALSNGLKVWTGRARPQLVSALDQVSTASFPSGHALVSSLFYVTVALLLAPLLPAAWMRRALLAAAIALSFAMGLSRIALGVHWPTDVLGGWALAAVWLGLCLLVARRFWPAVQA